jgi:hypothetical protein
MSINDFVIRVSYIFVLRLELRIRVSNGCPVINFERLKTVVIKGCVRYTYIFQNIYAYRIANCWP